MTSKPPAISRRMVAVVILGLMHVPLKLVPITAGYSFRKVRFYVFQISKVPPGGNRIIRVGPTIVFHSVIE